MQINRQIRDREIRLVSDSGEQLGVMPTISAFRLAEEQGMDLVKISPNANPPVCKILDYGKYRFEVIKKEKEAKKNQKIVELKEIRLSMTIDENDMLTKSKFAAKFLENGDKVKVSIRMKGRQNIRSEMGVDVMNGFYEIVKNVCTIEKKPLTEGRNIFMILAPLKQ